MFGMRFGDVAASSGSGIPSWINWNGLSDGTAQLFATDAGNINNMQGIVALDATRFLLIYETTSPQTLKCVIGTVSGTGVSYGTDFQIDTPTDGAPVNAFLLTTNRVIITYGSQFEFVCIDTSTNPPTRGNLGSFSSAGFNNSGSVTQLDSSTFLVVYQSRSVSGDINAATASVSGTTISDNTPGAVLTSLPATYPSVASYTTGKSVMFYADTSSFPTALVINTSGTSIGTIGSPKTIESSTIGGQNYAMKVISIDASTALAVYSLGATPNIRAMLLSMSGNTVSTNAAVTIKGSTSSLQVGTVIQLNATQAMITYGISGGATLYGVVINWTGTTIDTVGSEITINTASAAQFNQNQVISKMDANTVCSSMNDVSVSQKIGSLIIKRA